MATIQIEISNSMSLQFGIGSAIESLIAEAISELRKTGYTLSLRREATGIFCIELDQWIQPAAFEVDRYFQFRAIDNPDADRIVYAISFHRGVKGHLVDSCYVYADNISAELANKLQISPHPEPFDSPDITGVAKQISANRQHIV